MATTSSNPLAGKASAGQDGNGRYGRKAKLAAGVVALGCAAALIFGGLRAGGAVRHQPQAGPAASTAQASGIDHQRFLELNTQLPSEGGPAVDPTIDFGPVECGMAPCVTVPAFVPDQFTYREDRRAPAPDNEACAYASAAGVPGEGCKR